MRCTSLVNSIKQFPNDGIGFLEQEFHDIHTLNQPKPHKMRP